MKEVAELLNAMRDAGVISEYALFGAIARILGLLESSSVTREQVARLAAHEERTRHGSGLGTQHLSDARLPSMLS
jgi:hypothetical protein